MLSGWKAVHGCYSRWSDDAGSWCSWCSWLRIWDHNRLRTNLLAAHGGSKLSGLTLTFLRCVVSCPTAEARAGVGFGISGIFLSVDIACELLPKEPWAAISNHLISLAPIETQVMWRCSRSCVCGLYYLPWNAFPICCNSRSRKATNDTWVLDYARYLLVLSSQWWKSTCSC